MQQETALTVPGTAARTVDVSDTVPTKPSISSLAGRAKAAIVVRLLLNEGADIPLEELPDELQGVLTHQMGTMGLVDRDTLFSVVQEFAEMLDGVGLSFPKGIGGALTILDGRISPQTAARLRKEAGVRMTGDPWDRLRALPAEDLAELVQAESTEIAAVILSKLDVPKAAELLGKLSGPDARRITYAVSQTGAVTPDTVDRIGISLAAQLDDKPLVAFDTGPGERVGAILNLSPATTREDMLTALDEEDADFASVVRKSIFTFAHIAERLSPRDVPQVIREVDQGDLIVALAFAALDPKDTASADFILSNISSRMADNLREEVAEKGKIKPADGESAMNTVVGAIRGLEQAGDIELILPEGEEDAA
ncbi:FliG C-terminal domain-containing protein [Aliisedimentitalea scapharcae]|uniref:Flagellar motor switch protein FliG n=1 Tax=Aliisedimentitalea scapharcae TaxID=1524259 RepID=A0ABZ2XXN8_9RHOB|nr:flagellar motor switch protein FliG [Rhodobacteraceae bacterium M382]